jgi:hypothetical protein
MDSLSHLLAVLFYPDQHINFGQLQRVCVIMVSKHSTNSQAQLTLTTNALRGDSLDQQFLMDMKQILPSTSIEVQDEWFVVRGTFSGDLNKDLLLEGVLGFCVIRPVIVYKLLIIDPQTWRRLEMIDHLGVIENKVINGKLLSPEEIVLLIGDEKCGLFWESKVVYASPPDLKEILETISTEFGLDPQAVNHLELKGPGWTGFGLIGFGPQVPKGSIGLMTLFSGRPVGLPTLLALQYRTKISEELRKRHVTTDVSQINCLFPVINIPLAKEETGALIILSIHLQDEAELTLYSLEQELPKSFTQLINSKVCPKYSKLLWSDAAHKLMAHQGREFKKISQMVLQMEQLLTQAERKRVANILLDSSADYLVSQDEHFSSRFVELLTDKYCNI